MSTFLTVFWSLYAIGAIVTFLLVGAVVMDSLKEGGDLYRDKEGVMETAGVALGSLIIFVIILVGLVAKSAIWWYWLLPSKKD